MNITMIRTRKKIVVLLMLICCITACQKKNEAEGAVDMREMISDIQEVVEDKQITIKPTEKPIMEPIEKEEKKEKRRTFTYEGADVVLTDENFEKTMKRLLWIETETAFYQLEDLPLTEEFFNECIQNYPFLESIEEVREFKVRFWGMKADSNMVCLCEFNKGDNYIMGHGEESDYYYVELEMLDGQISGMIVTLVEKNEPKEWNKR